MRLAACLASVLLLFLGWLIFGQSPNTINQNATKRTNPAPTSQTIDIDNLIASARTAPPEVAADIFLAIGSPPCRFTEKQRCISLVNDSFDLGNQAQAPFQQKSTSLMVDCRSGFKGAAFNLQLDRLSLRSKAVTKMIPFDPLRAREMFEQISLPTTDNLTCKDTLVPDFHVYYEAMGFVAEQCFTSKEKKVSLPAQFLANQIEKVKTIPQLTPAELVLLNSKTTPEQLSLLANLITKAMGRVSYDPRAFAFAIERDSFFSTTSQLISKLKDDNIPTQSLTEATRSFLIRNMSAEVCGDTHWIQNGTTRLPRGVEFVNIGFANPITIDEIQPASIGPKGEDVIYWSTPQAKAVMEAARVLRFGDGETELSIEEKASEQWHDHLMRFLDLIRNWSPESEASEDDYFEERCNMYNVVVELCPDNAQRDIVLREYANYLKDVSSRYKGRMEWILPLKGYLNILREQPEVSQKASLDPLLSSSDVSLRSYAQLSLITPAKNMQGTR
ncbi:MAG TPA: hypothetical protein VE863_07975 [Pyrinomonadaceae bacterium]|jgi:hypothetical protein|nr:hypothetical protein [Pyrinomonadaceae bacterium]